MAPTLTLHILPPSHPCKTVEAALRVKGLDAEIVTMTAGAHNDELEAIYGAGNRTVPGMLVDGEPVHGSRAILERLEEIASEPSLYPAPICRSAAVGCSPPTMPSAASASMWSIFAGSPARSSASRTAVIPW